jgi:hypothetical protein
MSQVKPPCSRSHYEDLLRSGSDTGVVQRLCNSHPYREIRLNFTLGLGTPSSSNLNVCVFGWGAVWTWMPSVSYVLGYSIAITYLLSLWLFGVLLSVFKEGLWLCLSQASVFQIVRFAPLCLSSLLLAQSLDRK